MKSDIADKDEVGQASKAAKSKARTCPKKRPEAHDDTCPEEEDFLEEETASLQPETRLTTDEPRLATDKIKVEKAPSRERRSRQAPSAPGTVDKSQRRRKRRTTADQKQRDRSPPARRERRTPAASNHSQAAASMPCILLVAYGLETLFWHGERV